MIPKADRRKDLEAKVIVGYFIGYSKTKAGCRVLLGDIVVTSVNVLFGEAIPESYTNYFCELDEATEKVHPEEQHVSDFDWLVGQFRMDADFIDLLPSDAIDRIAKDQVELIEQEQMYVDNFSYRSLLGALLYLSMNTRPDIAYAVGLLSRFGAKPALHTCKLMIYLRGTVAKGIRFSGGLHECGLS